MIYRLAGFLVRVRYPFYEGSVKKCFGAMSDGYLRPRSGLREIPPRKTRQSCSSPGHRLERGKSLPHIRELIHILNLGDTIVI